MCRALGVYTRTGLWSDWLLAASAGLGLQSYACWQMERVLRILQPPHGYHLPHSLAWRPFWL